MQPEVKATCKCALVGKQHGAVESERLSSKAAGIERGKTRPVEEVKSGGNCESGL